MYYFLCSSLPGLKFEEKPFYSCEEFDKICRTQLSAKAMEELEKGSLFVQSNPEYSDNLCGVYKKFARMEQYIRTYAAKKRSTVDDEKNNPIPNVVECFTYLDAELAQASLANALDREKMLDKIRWRELENLVEDDFDFSFLCVYRLKLQLIEKYTHRLVNEGKKNFQVAVEQICK